MTVKTFLPFFKATGTVSLKVLRGLWKMVCVLATGCGYILRQGGKHYSAADEDARHVADLKRSNDEYAEWAASNNISN